MAIATICSHGSQGCWDVALTPSNQGFDWLAHGEKLLPAAIAFAVSLFLYWLNKRNEKRKLSLETYKEFFSEDVATSRYKAEAFFQEQADVDWQRNDPYEVHDPNGFRVGYSAVTRYWARLSILYRENELDRRLTAKLLGRLMGYWWGLAYEEMTKRANMYTSADIKRLFFTVRDGGPGGKEFTKGYQSGLKRRADSVDLLRASRRIGAALGDETKRG